MKKIAFLLILFAVCLVSNAQKKSGTIYSEHESIEKTRELWSAFVKGDSEKLLSFLTDSVHVVMNGTYTKQPKNFFKESMEWWSGVENLKAGDDAQANPDALEYISGQVWVQDWMRVTGTHRESGIPINIHVHNLYGFNKAGLIQTFYQYFDDSFFDKIKNSLQNQ